MRALTCKRTARMISLYVAGDLVGAPEREVAVHLGACEPCRRLAEEFRASGSLLVQASIPPEFSAEFYSGIRQAVLGEIATDRSLSKPSLFRPRWLYATAFAAIVIVSGLMLQHFVSVKRAAPSDIARAPEVTVQPTSGSTEVPSRRKNHELLGTEGAQASRNPAHLNLRRSSRHSEGTSTPDALVIAQAGRGSNMQIEAAMQSRASLGPVALETPSRVSRIEIQTADPNIRIIWLSPGESREPAETNHDQNHPETSNRK